MTEFEELMDEMEKCRRCFEDIDLPKFFDRRWFVDSDLALVGLAPSIHRIDPKLILARNVKVYIDKFLQIVGRNRKNVYMTNLVKCTIPKLRTGETKKCMHFLVREINLVNPKYVVLFGRDVVDTVLLHNYPLSGKVVHMNNRIYVTSFHPSAVYRGTISETTFLKSAEVLKSIMCGGLDKWLK